jgi:hypothetical protein
MFMEPPTDSDRHSKGNGGILLVVGAASFAALLALVMRHLIPE